MYAEAFRRRGYCTLQADTAADAYRLASELPPAAIVTDAILDGPRDGIDLVHLLKSDATTWSIPLVILTGYVYDGNRERLLRAGCDLFLLKPCLPDTLAERIDTLVIEAVGVVPFVAPVVADHPLSAVAPGDAFTRGTRTA